MNFSFYSLSLYIYNDYSYFIMNHSSCLSALSHSSSSSSMVAETALIASLLPSPIAKNATFTSFSSWASPSQVSIFYKPIKISRSLVSQRKKPSLNTRCQVVFPNDNIDSKAFTASPLQLLKSSPANSESTLTLI